MAAGSIVVDLSLRTGTFESDTGRASAALKKMQKDAEATGKAIGVAFGAAVVGAAAGLFYMVKSSIDAADHLNDLAQKTGIAADTLGGLGFAGKQAGIDLDSVAAGAGKLNKSLAEAAAGGKEASEAFTALGISVKDASGQTKKADVVIAEIADKFQGYADGPEKAALALRLFGKAGANMIPLLNGGGAAIQGQIDYFKRYSGVTVETTKAADQFNDQLAKLSLLTGAFGKILTAELLTPLAAVAQRLLESKEQGDGFASAARGIKDALVGLATVASFVVESLSAISDRLTGIIRKGEALSDLAAEARKNSGPLDIFGSGSFSFGKTGAAFKAIDDDTAAGVASAQKRYDRFVAGLNFKVDPADYSNEGRSRAITKKPPAPRLPAKGGGSTDDPTRKLFENQLKALEAFVQQEKDLYQSRNRFLDLYNSQGLLSIQSYFEARQTINKAALTAELSAIDQEIALAQKRSKAPGVSERDKADAQGKVEELARRRAKLERQAGEEGLALAFQQEQAYKAFADQLLQVNAQVADLAENFRLAAAIKFEQQFGDLRNTFDKEGNAAGVEAIKILKDAALAQADFQKASLATSRTFDALQNAEARVALAEQTGALGSLEALAKLGDARRAQIPILEAQVAAQEAAAKASRSVFFPEGDPKLVKMAEDSRLALDRLKASVDPLAESLNKTFGSDFNSALDDFVTRTKNAAQAFNSFAKSVLNDILKMGSKSITESIFGGSGGAGGFISDLVKQQGGAGQGLIGGLKNLLGGSTVTTKAPAAADDGTTAGIQATIASLGGLTTGVDAATATISTQTAAVAQSTGAFGDLGATVGKFFTDIFSSGVVADSAATVAKSAETTAVSATTLALGTLATAAGSAAAALASVAASSASSSVGSAAAFAGLFAEGGTIPPGQFGIVGERGPEFAFGGTTGQTITPIIGGKAQTINVVNLAPARTSQQDAVISEISGLGPILSSLGTALGAMANSLTSFVGNLAPSVAKTLSSSGSDGFLHKPASDDRTSAAVRVEIGSLGGLSSSAASTVSAFSSQSAAAVESARAISGLAPVAVGDAASIASPPNSIVGSVASGISDLLAASSGPSLSPAKVPAGAIRDTSTAISGSAASDALQAGTGIGPVLSSFGTAFGATAGALGSAVGTFASGLIPDALNVKSRSADVGTTRAIDSPSVTESARFGPVPLTATAADSLRSTIGGIASGLGDLLSASGISASGFSPLAKAQGAISSPERLFSTGFAVGSATLAALTPRASPLSSSAAPQRDGSDFAGLGSALSSVGEAFGSVLSEFSSKVSGLISSLSFRGDSGFVSALASLFSGFHADGGFIPPGQFGVVGERGPELAFGGKSGQTITPGGKSQTINVNVNVQGAPNQSRDSLLQQGATIGTGIQRALARNT